MENLNEEPEWAKDIPDPSTYYLSDVNAKSPTVSTKDIKADYDKSVGIKGMAKGSFSSDEEEWVRSAAQTLYPDEPVDKARQRFQKSREGDWYHVAEDGNYYKVRPEGIKGIAANVASGTGYALPTATGAVAGILGAGAGPVGGAIMGTAGGATGEYYRQKLGDAILGDASTSEGDFDVNPVPIGMEAMFGLSGEILGRGGSHLFNKRTAKDLQQFDPQRTQEAYDRGARYGIPITPAEGSRLQSLRSQQLVASRAPQTANRMQAFDEMRNEKAQKVLNDYLDTNFGPDRDAASVSKDAVEFAKQRVLGAQKERTNIVKPMFDVLEKQDEAFKQYNIPNVDTSSAHQFIDQQLKTAKGGTYKALIDIKRALQSNTNPKNLDTSFKGVQNAKMFINDLLTDDATRARYGLTGAESQQEGAISRISQLIDNSLKTAKGNTGIYEQANQQYAQATKDLVNPVREALAPIMRVNPELGTMLTKAGTALMNEESRSPQLVKNARELFVQSGQSQLWDDLVRQFLKSKIVKAELASDVDPKRNYAGIVSRPFFKLSTDKNVEAAMHPSQYAAFKDIMKLFDDMNFSFYKNSETTFNQMAVDEAKKNIGFGATAVKMSRPLNWMENAQNELADRFREKQADILTDIITSGDINLINKLRSMKTVPLKDERKMIFVLQTLQRAGYLAPTMTGTGDPYPKDIN